MTRHRSGRPSCGTCAYDDTRPGRTTVPAGPCRGTRSDLANPQPRATLVADAFGLATTHVQATPAMCGRTLVQALDEGSCLVTEVVAVPATVVP